MGASASHEVKCFSVGQRRMSVPISATICRAACRTDAVDLAQVGVASEPLQRASDIEVGLMLGAGLAAGREQRGEGRRLLGGQLAELLLDRGIALRGLLERGGFEPSRPFISRSFCGLRAISILFESTRLG